MEMCQQRESLSFDKTNNKVEMGYVAHLTRLAQLLQQIGEKNEIIREQFDENNEWKNFESSYLRPRIEKRTGNLCRGQQKKKESRFLSMFDDDEDDGDAPIEMFSRDDDYGGGLEDQRTNQKEIDELMKQPCLEFDEGDEDFDPLTLLKPRINNYLQDDDDDTGPDKNDGEEQQEYSMEKYFSNGDIDRGHIKSKANKGKGRRYGSDDDDDDYGAMNDGMDDDEEGYANRNKAKKNNKARFDSDDDDDINRGDEEPFSLEELDGWMNKINKE